MGRERGARPSLRLPCPAPSAGFSLSGCLCQQVGNYSDAMPISSKSLPSRTAARENESASLKKYRYIHTLMGATATAESQWSDATRQGRAEPPRSPRLSSERLPAFPIAGLRRGRPGAAREGKGGGLRGPTLEAASARRSGSRSMFAARSQPPPSIATPKTPQSEGLPGLQARAEAGWEGHRGKARRIRSGPSADRGACRPPPPPP